LIRKKVKYKRPKSDNYLNAIIYCSEPQVNGNQFLKYRAIKNDATKISAFMAFAKGFPSAQYVNFYYELSRKFKERIYLQ